MKCDICLKEIKEPIILSFSSNSEKLPNKKSYNLCYSCYTDLFYIIHRKIGRNLSKKIKKARKIYLRGIYEK
jgi:hypothetical protein